MKEPPCSPVIIFFSLCKTRRQYTQGIKILRMYSQIYLIYLSFYRSIHPPIYLCHPRHLWTIQVCACCYALWSTKIIQFDWICAAASHYSSSIVVAHSVDSHEPTKISWARIQRFFFFVPQLVEVRQLKTGRDYHPINAPTTQKCKGKGESISWVALYPCSWEGGILCCCRLRFCHTGWQASESPREGWGMECCMGSNLVWLVWVDGLSWWLGVV